MVRLLSVIAVIAFQATGVLGSITADGEIVPQDYLNWKYTDMNPNCTSAGGYRSSCADIRICNYALASIKIGGWPTRCGSVANIVPKVCCGVPLVLGEKLMKRVDEQEARNRHCGTGTFRGDLSPIQELFFETLFSLPPVDKSNPEKYDPPLDLNVPMYSSPVGGRPSRQGEYPWMVAITRGRNTRIWCGGTLIDRVHVLSAAHCFSSQRYGPEPNLYQVRVGNIYVDEGYPYNVTDIKVHEGYVPGQYYHDIAILTLSEEILVPEIAHICLPSPEFAAKDLTGENTTMLGWGHTESGGTTTPILHVVDNVKVVPIDECKQAFRVVARNNLPRGMTDDFICAGLPEGGKDACQKDSGGPLMYLHNYQHRLEGHPDIPWVQVGVVSFGYLCGEPGFPGVYTKVANYVGWIEKNTGSTFQRLPAK